MKENNDFLYDEDDSVEFIRKALPQEVKEKFTNDDINYLVDLIYNFYDTKGYFEDEEGEGNDEEMIDINEDELIAYVVKNALKDGVGRFDPEHIELIVQAELDYCESINLFE